MDRMILLDRHWRFSVDNEAERRAASAKPQWKFRNIKAGHADGFASIGYDDSHWELVDLPHDYGVRTGFSPDNCRMRGAKDEVNVWYRKNFLMDEALSDRHFTLIFEGISMKAEIYFNGSLLASVPGAYTWTEIDVTPRMHFGNVPNYMTVSVRGDVPQIWKYEGTGIYDHVRLLVRDPLHVAYNGLWAYSEKCPDGHWDLHCEAEIENRTYEPWTGKLVFELRDREGNCAGRVERDFAADGDSRESVKAVIPMDAPHLWDLDDPYLYRVVCSVQYDGKTVDADQVNAGFRTAEFRGPDGFFLNGKKVFIKGFNSHFEHAGVGFAVPESIQEYRIGRIRSMGGNTYRSGHNECPESVLDACDRQGMLFINENRFFETREENLEMLRRQIRRERKHPSVILYNLFNEEAISSSPEGARIYRKLKSVVSKLDNTRLFTGCAQQLAKSLTVESVLQPMDVIGTNYEISSLNKAHETFPEKAFLATEMTCMQTMRGELRYDPEKKLFDDYALENHWFGTTLFRTMEVMREHPFCCGLLNHSAFDYRGEPQPFDYPLISCTYGAMDTCGFPKTLYYIYQAWFLDRPVLYIFPHWNHKAGEEVRVLTVTNCDQCELFLNGKSLGVKECHPCEPCLWSVVFEPGTLTAFGYREGKKSAEYTVKTAGAPVRLIAEPHRMHIKNDGYDAVAVNVCAVDGEGNVCPDADMQVAFRVTGGKVLGVGNGNPQSHEPDYALTRKLYHSRCQAIVACEPGADALKIEASSSGLEPGLVTMEVENVPSRMELPGSDSRQLDSWKMVSAATVEKPDPTRKIEWSENNAFLSVNMATERFQNDLQPGWMFYQTEIAIPNSAGKNCHAVFHFGRARYSECEVWVNGELHLSRKSEQDQIFGDDVNFETKGASSLLLTILLRTSGGQAGINGRDAILSIDIA